MSYPLGDSGIVTGGTHPLGDRKDFGERSPSCGTGSGGDEAYVYMFSSEDVFREHKIERNRSRAYTDMSPKSSRTNGHELEEVDGL